MKTKMPTFVEDLSEEDEVIVVPYVKPPPPMIVLSESEGEGEADTQSTRERSNKLPPKTKENVSRSTSSGGLRTRRDAPSSAEGGSRQKDKDKQSTGQDENRMPDPPASPNIFHPSETAIMDTSRTSMSNESAEETPSPSSATATAQARKRKGSHSTRVKEQFASFLKGINLPPPPPIVRPSKTTMTTETEGPTGKVPEEMFT